MNPTASYSTIKLYLNIRLLQKFLTAQPSHVTTLTAKRATPAAAPHTGALITPSHAYTQ